MHGPRLIYLFLIGYISDVWAAVTHCFMSTGGGCDTEHGWLPHQDQCYFVSNTVALSSVNWHEARAFCLQHGGELASLHAEADADLLAAMADDYGYRGSAWVGLNRLQDRNADFQWTDGSERDFLPWEENEPSESGLELCAAIKLSSDSACYTRHEQVNFFLERIPRPDSLPEGCRLLRYIHDLEACEKECGRTAGCQAYTYSDNRHPSSLWRANCFACGRDMIGALREEEHTTSGEQAPCPAVDNTLESVNCGEKRGFVCQKRPGSDGPATAPPTAELPGYCPAGYQGFSNKCYKLVSLTDEDGLAWQDALDLCRGENGPGADLASLSTPQEQAAVTALLTEHAFGYWIGYFRGPGYRWMWTDNSDPTYNNFKGRDRAACATVATHSPPGHWDYTDCKEKRGYICQIYKDPADVIPTPWSPAPSACPAGFVGHGWACYKAELLPKTWSSAESHCRRLDAHLASVHDQTENALLFSLARGYAPLWIGMERVGDEYLWSDGWPELFTAWGAGQPAGGDGCVAMDTDTTWRDDSCSQERAFVCKWTEVPAPTTPAPVEGTCPDANWEEFGGHCYYVAHSGYPNFENKDFHTAQEFCYKRGLPHHNATLASVHNRVTNEWLLARVREQLPPDRAWIGLGRQDTDSPWEWVNGEPANYFHWAPGEPSVTAGEQCVEMRTETWPGLWSIGDCGGHWPFVCMAQKVHESELPTLPPVAPGDCPAPNWLAYGDKCFIVSSYSYKSWEEAGEKCRELGGHSLAVIRDADENRFLWLKLRAASPKPDNNPVFIGLRGAEDGKSWEWSDGSPVSYTNWASGQPIEGGRLRCGQMLSGDGTWREYDCRLIDGYLCQYTKPAVSTSSSSGPERTSPTPSSSEGPGSTDEGGMSGGAVAGLVIGLLAAAALLGLGAFFGLKTWRSRTTAQDDENAYHPYDNFKN